MLTLLAAVTVAAAAFAFAQPGEVRAKSSYDGWVKACNGKEVYLRAPEKKTLRLHNQARVSRDKPRLCIDQRFQRAARSHSSDMLRNDYFSHDSQNGDTFSQRIKSFGYTPGNMSVYRVGENIGGGSGSHAAPRDRHKAWMNSEGHRKNILKRGFRHVGIGVASGEYKSYDDYKMYTVDFGFRRR